MYVYALATVLMGTIGLSVLTLAAFSGKYD